eukprot:jgi/Mesvir1/13662/Mv21260-RA.1
MMVSVYPLAMDAKLLMHRLKFPWHSIFWTTLRIALVVFTISLFAILKPKEYTFLDILHTLFYGRPNALTEADGQTVKKFREAPVSMRTIAVITIALITVMGEKAAAVEQ